MPEPLAPQLNLTIVLHMLDAVLEVIDRAPFAALNGAIRACRVTSRRAVDRSKYIEKVNYTLDGTDVEIQQYPNGVRCGSATSFEPGNVWSIAYVDGVPWRITHRYAVIDVKHGLYLARNHAPLHAFRLCIGIGTADVKTIPPECLADVIAWMCDDIPPPPITAEFLVQCEKYGAMNTAAWMYPNQPNLGALLL